MLVTQVISAMTVTLCLLIDSIMIGRFLGVDPMTAYGLSNPLLLIFAALGTMISAGVQVMCGKSIGSGDRDGTDANYSASVVMALAIAAVGFIAVFFFTGPLATLLGAGHPGPDNVVFDLTVDYLKGFIVGAPAFLCAQLMIPFLQLSGGRRRLVVAVIAMIVCDVALDFLNVLVFHGGMFGMGLASSLSYYAAFLIGIGYFLRKDCLFRFRPKKVTAAICGTMIHYGVPTVINQISVVLVVFLLNHVLLSVQGNVAVAAYSVISTIANICYCFGSGCGAVALMLSAIFYSDEDRRSLQKLVKVMTMYAAGLGAAVMVIVFLAAPVLVPLFLTGGTEAKGMAVLGTRLFTLSLVPSALNTTYKNYFQGVSHIRLAELLSFLQSFAMKALFALSLSGVLGVTGVWLCHLGGETVTLLLLAAVVWHKCGAVRFTADAFSMLPADFGAAPENCMEHSVRDLDSAIEVSRLAGEFCEAHGMDDRKSFVISLAIEEMVANILKHGFTADNKKHNVDVRLITRAEGAVIRIRDNCEGFDPLHYLELHNADDAVSHLGIRMVMAMVTDAAYVNSLGLNNLTLKL